MKKIGLFTGIFFLMAVSAHAAPQAKEFPAEAVDRPTATDLTNIGDYVNANPDCQADADCKDVNPNDCKGVKCVPYKSIYNPAADAAPITVGKCQTYEIPGCEQGACTSKYPSDPAAAKCCEMGLDGPDTIKCCQTHVAKNEPVVDASGKLIPCDGGNNCPECPKCHEPPKVDCSVIGDAKMKACCKEVDGLLWFVMDKCIEDGPGSEGDCNIVINAGGDFINEGQLNICCQVVNNSGTITDTTISQACGNTTGGGPGGSPTGGTPTTPSGSASALTCSVAMVGAPVDGKFAISYTVPASAGPVVSATLTQLSGSQIKVEGESEPADFGSAVTSPKAMSTKSISDPNNPPSFTVFAPTPKSMAGEWKAPFEVKVSLSTLEGETASALCTEEHYLHAEGQGCGCHMTAQLSGREQVWSYLVMALTLLTTLGALQALKTKARR